MANDNNQAIYRWHQNGVLYMKQMPYAGGGKGLPSPLHPRPMGVCPLEPQIDAVVVGNVSSAWLWYAETNELRTIVSAYQSYKPVH